MARRDEQTDMIVRSRNAVIAALRRWFGRECREETEGELRAAWERYEGLLNRAMGVDHESRVASLEGQRRRRTAVHKEA